MKFLPSILDLLYPPKCMFCHSLLKKGENNICTSCAASLPLLEESERRQSFGGVSNCSSLFSYEGSVRESLLRYKFHEMQSYSAEYARLICSNLEKDELSCDVISWVPLSRKRLRSRGYDQARLLAEGIALNSMTPCIRVLEKNRNVAPQSGIGGRQARKANIRGAYRIAAGAEITGKRILLADDIVTTGSTLAECAKVLLLAGAADVKAVTVARRNLNGR